MGSIEEVVRQIGVRLATGIGDDAPNVDDMIVLPVLSSLGWDIADPAQVAAQKVGSHAEYLCLLGQGRPCAFIERTVFRQKLEAGAARLRRHAAENGVCLAVLTNGVAWWFFTPQDGQWPNVPSAVADLTSRNIVPVLQDLRRHMAVSSAFYARAPEPLPKRRLIDSASRPQAKAPRDCGTIGARGPHATGRSRRTGHIVRGLCPPPYSTPVAVIWGGERLAVRYWNEVLVQTAEWLIRNGEELPYDRKVKRSRWILVSRDLHTIKQRPHRLSNGAYIETDYSSSDCIYWAQWLMDRAGYRQFATEYIEPS